MRKYWLNLSAREKMLVGIACSLIMIIALWQFALKPLLAFPDTQQKIYLKTESDLNIMREGQSALVNFRPVEKSVLATNDLLSAITRSAGEHGLVISRRQPNGDTVISLWFANATAPKFYKWLDTLTKEHAVTVLRASINRNDDKTIQAQITFELGV